MQKNKQYKRGKLIYTVGSLLDWINNILAEDIPEEDNLADDSLGEGIPEVGKDLDHTLEVSTPEEHTLGTGILEEDNLEMDTHKGHRLEGHMFGEDIPE